MSDAGRRSICGDGFSLENKIPGTTLDAGAARRAINPQLGTGKAGLRLFGSPIQAIESDLTATALVLGDGDTKVAVIAIERDDRAPVEPHVLA